MESRIETLKEWTQKDHGVVVYDSKTDPFTGDALFEKIKNKPDIAIIGTTNSGDVFGGFYGVPVPRQGDYFYDPNIFAFSFESRGRCTTPQRFRVKKENRHDALVFFSNYDGCQCVEFKTRRFDGMGLGSPKMRTFCISLSQLFEGLEDTTLTGVNIEYQCMRVVAIHLFDD